MRPDAALPAREGIEKMAWPSFATEQLGLLPQGAAQAPQQRGAALKPDQRVSGADLKGAPQRIGGQRLQSLGIGLIRVRRIR